MKKFFAVLALLPMLAQAEEPKTWIEFGQGASNTIWEFKRGSLTVIKGDNDAPYWIVQFRLHEVNKTEFDFVKIAVSLEDCRRGAGSLLVVDMQNAIKTKKDFVFDGETLGSDIAKAICANGDRALKNSQKQQQEEQDTVKT